MADTSIEIIMGRAGSGKTHRCLSDMVRIMKSAPLSKPLFIIVPDHDTYRVECSLAEMMGGENGFGFVGAQVLGFRRLALQTIQTAGGEMPQAVSELGRRLMIKKILLDKEAEFCSFGGAVRQSGFVGELSSLVAEFKSYGVVSAYREHKEKFENREQLRQKLEDMDILQTAYDAALKSGETVYSDMEELMKELLFLVPDSLMFAGAEIWIDGFAFFEPLELEIIKSLYKRGCKLHVTLNIDRLEAESGELSIFQRQRDTYRNICKIAAGKVENTVMKGKKPRYAGVSAEVLSEIEEKLFSLNTQVQEKSFNEEECSNIRLVEAANRRQEIELMAADIRRLCREEGYSYRDIAVLIRDWNDYGFMLPLVMADYSIPVYCDRKVPAIDHPLAELIVSVLGIFTGSKDGWRYESVFRALKTGFFPASEDEIDILENYVVEFGIKGKKWFDDSPWPYYRNQRGEEAAEEESREEEQLRIINDIRSRVVEPLKKLSQVVLDEKSTVGDISAGLYSFLTDLAVPEKLNNWAVEAEESGDPEKARRHQLIWNQILNLLEEMTKTIGGERLEEDNKANLKNYSRIIVDGINHISFSMVPPGLDYVTVAAFDGNSMDNIKAVYVLGVNAGIMPKGVSEPLFISREERNELEELLEIKLPGGRIEEESLKERYTLYRGFTRMREYLWVSYSLADGEGNALLPSQIIERLERLVPSVKQNKLTVGDTGLVAVPGEEERLHIWQLANKRQAAVKLAGAMRELRRNSNNGEDRNNEFTGNDLIWPIVFDKLIVNFEENDKSDSLLNCVIDGLTMSAGAVGIDRGLARELYSAGKKLRGSVSSIQNYYGCPFRYYAQRGLRLRKRDEFSFAAVDKGNLLHGVMELFAEEIKKRNKSELKDADCTQLAKELTEKAAQNIHNRILLRDEQMKGLLSRIEMTAERAISQLMKLSVSSAFETAAVEKEFTCPGKGQDAEAWQLADGITMELQGKIDRIDTMEHQRESGDVNGYVLVIDYKTGSTALALKDIYDGQNLQLITYLMAAMELRPGKLKGITIIPAGLYYFYLKNRVIPQDALDAEKAALESAKEMRLAGWTLDDDEIMDLISRGQQCVDVKKSTVSRGAKKVNKNAQSEEFFGAVQQFVREKLLTAGREIIDGKNEAHPYFSSAKKNSCLYCDYRSVCGFDVQIDGFDYRYAAGLTDEEIKAQILEALSDSQSNKEEVKK